MRRSRKSPFGDYRETWAIPAGLAGMLVIGIGLSMVRWFYPFLLDRPNLNSIVQQLFPGGMFTGLDRAITAFEGGVMGSVFGFCFGFYLGYGFARKRT